jgi:hypothetical protein
VGGVDRYDLHGDQGLYGIDFFDTTAIRSPGRREPLTATVVGFCLSFRRCYT